MFWCLFGDADTKKQARDALPDTIKPICEGLERILSRKTTTGAFFFSNTGPTLADLAVYNLIESPFPGFKALGVDLQPYPRLRRVAEAVSADPRIKAYYSNQTF